MVLASEFESVDKGQFNYYVNSFLPAFVQIPFEEGDELLVSAGDSVSEGQLIIKGKKYTSHAPLPGTVTEIVEFEKDDGLHRALKIKLSGEFKFTGKKLTPAAWKNLDNGTICYILSQKGVINTFAETADLGNQIKEVSKDKRRVLVVRLFDEDPSRLSDTFIASKKLDQILEGAAVISKAMDSSATVFAYDKNAQFPFEEKIHESPFGKDAVCAGIDTSRYPDGFRHDLVKAVRQQNNDSRFTELGTRDLFADVQAVLAAYEAVVLNKPVITRYVHVTGDCLNAAAIMSVRHGVSFRNIAEQCGGFKRKVDKIVINGMVTGFSETDIDLPLAKDVKSIEFVPVSRISKRYTEPCIRCGNCRYVCPVGIYPDMLYKAYFFRTRDWVNDEEVNSMSVLCTDCQLCNTVCPSRLPVSQTVSLLRDICEGGDK